MNLCSSSGTVCIDRWRNGDGAAVTWRKGDGVGDGLARQPKCGTRGILNLGRSMMGSGMVRRNGRTTSGSALRMVVHCPSDWRLADAILQLFFSSSACFCLAIEAAALTLVPGCGATGSYLSFKSDPNPQNFVVGAVDDGGHLAFLVKHLIPRRASVTDENYLDSDGS